MKWEKACFAETSVNIDESIRHHIPKELWPRYDTLPVAALRLQTTPQRGHNWLLELSPKINAGVRPNHLTYLLTPWCRVLLEKLTGLQLVKKFPAFYGTRRFITALTSIRHPSLSWASPIQSIYPHPTSWRSILILSTHLRLGLPSGLLPSGFPTKNLYTPSPHP